MVYRIQVQNIRRDGGAIKNCEGQLTEVAFEEEDAELAATALTWCGDHPPKTKVDLNVGFTRELDVVALYENGSVAITTPGWPPNNREDFFFRHGHYRFAVVIGGDGTAPLPAYKLRLNYTGDWQTSTMEPV